MKPSAVKSETAVRSPFDLAAVRGDFPILAARVHGKPLVYLDNAATTQKPPAVIDALRDYYLHDNANIHRGVHLLSERATAQYEAAREVVRRFLNARHSREIIFVRGTTEGINLVAQSYARQVLRPGDEIVVSVLEHHSNFVPWKMVADEKGARLRVVPITDDGELRMDEYERLLSERTRLVALGHVSNALGTINPVADIVRLAHARGIPVLLDGAQAVAHVPVDVQALGCDFYAFSGHKMFGPTGIGVLYGRSELLDGMPPWQGGGDMISSVSLDEVTYNTLPAKFEAGTPNIAGAIGLAAAIDYFTALDLGRARTHEDELLRLCRRAARGDPGRPRHRARLKRTSIASFVMDHVHPHDIGTILDREGIAIRTGHHCCQPLMQRLGVPATARASLAFYNTRGGDRSPRLGARARQGGLRLMSDLRELYQEVILDHHKRPRNFGALSDANHHAEGRNPLCGDHITVHVDIEDGVIKAVAFEGAGCAISRASASLMTDAVKGKPIAEAEKLFAEFHRMVTSGVDEEVEAALGKLAVFCGVREFPSRVKCASLAWHTLHAALQDKRQTVSTE